MKLKIFLITTGAAFTLFISGIPSNQALSEVPNVESNKAEQTSGGGCAKCENKIKALEAENEILKHDKERLREKIKGDGEDWEKKLKESKEETKREHDICGQRLEKSEKRTQELISPRSR